MNKSQKKEIENLKAEIAKLKAENQMLIDRVAQGMVEYAFLKEEKES